jgi:uncharacterized protein YceK
MKMSNAWLKFMVLMTVCFCLAGCLTVQSTIDSRRREYYAAYSALSPEFKAAVDAGTVKAGMNSDAVYIAWGRPTRLMSSGNKSGESTTWIYEGYYLREYDYVGYYRTHYGYVSEPYTRAKVVFANGVVTEWQRYEHP